MKKATAKAKVDEAVTTTKNAMDQQQIAMA